MQKGFISAEGIPGIGLSPFFVSFFTLDTRSSIESRGCAARIAQQWNNEGLGKLVGIAAIVARITPPYPPKPIVGHNVHKADYSIVKFCNFQPRGRWTSFLEHIHMMG